MKRLTAHPAFPYVAPFALFMALTALQGIHEASVYLIYPIKTLVVLFLILFLLRRLPPLTCTRPKSSLLLGLIVFLLWVTLGPLLLVQKTGPGFNPFLFEDPNVAWGSALIRIFGASVVVPVTEELFWRGFLMRWLIREDFATVEPGSYRPLSFWATTLLFASVHGAFIPVALLTGILYGGWFVKTRSLGDVMLAHATTNFLLGLYVLKTGLWWFW